MWESGLADHVVEKYFPKKDQCNPYNRGDAVPIKLDDLASVFFLWGVGLTISIAIFLFELIPKYKITCAKNDK